jgi:N-sulfoglucosamine sulfohydrolase
MRLPVWLSAALAAALLAPPALAARRNVVVIVADDHGPDLGCYGHKQVRTPHLDALAADGTRFVNAFCTTASCSASRSVILSGLHNHLNGQYGHQHHFHHFASFPSVKSLPVLLSAAGYRTAQVGKYHVAPETIYRFDTYLKGNQGGARNPVSMAEKCRDVIAAKDDRPFFLYFATADPHRGGGVIDSPEKPDRFGNGPKYDGVKEVVYDPAKLTVPPFLPDTPACRAELAQYLQSISRVDQGVGRLVAILKECGEYDNTLILYLSDNGMAFPGSKTTLYEPGMRLPLIVRGPDQKKRGGTTDALVSWADLTPTILAFAGVKDVPGPPAVGQPGPEIPDKVAPKKAKAAKAKPYVFHGRSFLDVLDTPKATGWDEVYASHTFHEITMYYPMRVLRGRQYKLIFNLAHPLPFPFASDLEASATWRSIAKAGPEALYGKRRIKDFIQRPRYELYDLKADPDEVKNLADDPKHAAVLKQLQAKLKAFQENTGDPWVVKYRYE